MSTKAQEFTAKLHMEIALGNDGLARASIDFGDEKIVLLTMLRAPFERSEEVRQAAQALTNAIAVQMVREAIADDGRVVGSTSSPMALSGEAKH